MNSFFIKNVKRDLDFGFNVIFSPIFEKSLMFVSTFLVWVLIDMSNAEISGAEDVN